MIRVLSVVVLPPTVLILLLLLPNVPRADVPALQPQVGTGVHVSITPPSVDAPFAAPDGTPVLWCYSGWGVTSGRQPEADGCILRHVDGSLAFNGQNPEGRYCAPQHDCTGEKFNGPYINNGDLGGEAGSASTAIASDELANLYGGAAKVPVQDLWDWAITHCSGPTANTCRTDSGSPPAQPPPPPMCDQGLCTPRCPQNCASVPPAPPAPVQAVCTAPEVCGDPPSPCPSCPSCPAPQACPQVIPCPAAPVLVAVPPEIAQSLKAILGYSVMGPGRHAQVQRVLSWVEGLEAVEEKP